MANHTTTYSGMGLTVWLTVLFVGLKLTGFIDWSWVWVLAPAWISLGLVILFLLIVLCVVALR